MGFSPWAILAIVLTAVALGALLSIHQWRIRVDRRQNPPAAAAADEKTADGQPAQPPPSDLGESGHGPGPGAAAVDGAPPPEPTPSRPSGVSSSADNADKASRGGSTTTADGRQAD
ncbi:uncharacterized protein BKCO1_6000107 [Diplodia corticola]|uniref:Uncharacterized protein n=1 Tax=Diplodia corticola TaxID=236234 RepID=A0A1J9SCX4_9PEZI|nr:uncharacterized protein BKCO1_6000107 [Diplodia corticola]OJD37700.1 hypothetical protein BKCO1_6000107 [Diplodia corticola]